MSDTSIISTISTYDSKIRRNKSHFSCWNRHWFHMIITSLSLIIISTSGILGYVLYKQTQRNQERRRVQKEFQSKHGLANKIVDMISKDGIITKWLKANKGETLKIFRELMTDMVNTIFGE
ncbi:unnamed protein product [Rotaria socialis]|uniref:Uncharacterized protein n=1 Tax=Rotaria socialis TaxID=392032 RepID=A0A818B8P3_9BILA|nr:unnamed protein product [Rotaria socialis]CAF3413432.1 unnamed protein product [Rotaria socialis]CAF3520815.1 unnamed protein product [Rotaria socialis]